MNYINNFLAFFGIGTENSPFDSASEALVTEYNELTNDNDVAERVEAQVDSVDRISEEGVFHTYSVARLDFDLGQYGDYPVELALPRFPEEESEIEEFMNRLGYDVNDLPRLEEGNFTVPFIRVDGEWHIDWENLETQETEVDEE